MTETLEQPTETFCAARCGYAVACFGWNADGSCKEGFTPDDARCLRNPNNAYLRAHKRPVEPEPLS